MKFLLRLRMKTSVRLERVKGARTRLNTKITIPFLTSIHLIITGWARVSLPLSHQTPGVPRSSFLYLLSSSNQTLLPRKISFNFDRVNHRTFRKMVPVFHPCHLVWRNLILETKLHLKESTSIILILLWRIHHRRYFHLPPGTIVMFWFDKTTMLFHIVLCQVYSLQLQPIQVTSPWFQPLSLSAITPRVLFRWHSLFANLSCLPTHLRPLHWMRSFNTEDHFQSIQKLYFQKISVAIGRLDEK